MIHKIPEILFESCVHLNITFTISRIDQRHDHVPWSAYDATDKNTFCLSRCVSQLKIAEVRIYHVRLYDSFTDKADSSNGTADKILLLSV